MLESEWPPEQIVGHLRLTQCGNPLMEISHESICRAIYTTRWKVIPRELCSKLTTGRPIRKNKLRKIVLGGTAKKRTLTVAW